MKQCSCAMESVQDELVGAVSGIKGNIKTMEARIKEIETIYMEKVDLSDSLLESEKWVDMTSDQTMAYLEPTQYLSMYMNFLAEERRLLQRLCRWFNSCAEDVEHSQSYLKGSCLGK